MGLGGGYFRWFRGSKGSALGSCVAGFPVLSSCVLNKNKRIDSCTEDALCNTLLSCCRLQHDPWKTRLRQKARRIIVLYIDVEDEAA